MKRLCVSLAFLGMFAAAVGCNRGHPTAPVSGSVSFKGKPMTTGRVLFVHETGASSFGLIGLDGRYELLAPVGANRVAIECLEEMGKPADPSNPYMRPMALAQTLIPERYSNHMTSGFTCDVTSTGNNADFELKE
jgi:hypothetical protein